MAIVPLVRFRGFTGINERDDPLRVIPSEAGAPFVSAENAIVDNSKLLKRRDGRNTVLTGTAVHSMWANASGTICFYMDGGTLKRLKVDYSTTTVLAGMDAGLTMRYAEIDTRIYATNYSSIGYIEGDVWNALADPSDTFKARMPAGQEIAAMGASLLVARDDVLYWGDPAAPPLYDLRSGFIPLGSWITNVCPVKDGVFVSTLTETGFIGGTSAADATFTLLGAYGGIHGASCQVPGAFFGDGTSQGAWWIWKTKQGICVGGDGGNFRNVTGDKEVTPDATVGCSLYQRQSGADIYIAAIR